MFFSVYLIWRLSSGTDYINYWRRGVVVITTAWLHSFIILLAVYRRFAIVIISDSSTAWTASTSTASTSPQKQFTIITDKKKCYFITRWKSLLPIRLHSPYIKTKWNPLKMLFFFIEKKAKVKWETPKEDSAVFVLF